MAARQSNGVGAFGWTLLGFLAGVAATLAVQVILVGRDKDDDQDEAPHSAPVVAVTPHLPAPKRKLKPVEAPASATQPVVALPATPHAKADAEAQQMADDAAAAGMTSRAPPSQNANRSDTPR